MHILLIISVVLAVYLLIYGGAFSVLHIPMRRIESTIVNIFLSKVAKIPALIEVMRPYVADEKAFETITTLHSEVMIRRYDTIYDLLEYNAKIQNQFLFLMQLSAQIPELQKHEYFLYVRDFIISYERDMKANFTGFNKAVSLWNKFVFVKSWTIIGFVLPGRSQSEI